MEIQPVVVHETSDEGVKGEPESLEEVRDKYDRLTGSRSRDNLPLSRKPVKDLRGQIPRIPELRDILLCDRGSHPPALRAGSGHDWEARSN